MSLLNDIGINYTSKRIYWKGASGGGSAYGFYTVKAFYQFLQGVMDDDAQMDDLDIVKFYSPTSYGGLNAWYYDPAIFKHLYGAGFQSGGYTGFIQMVQLDSGGFTSFIASDLDKQVKDDTVEVGYLVGYDNTARKIWVRSESTIAISSAITITSGTGAGTATAASSSGEDFFSNIYSLGSVQHGNFYIEQSSARLTSWWDGAASGIVKLTHQSGGYTSAVGGDIGKAVVGGTTGDSGHLLAYDNATREWWVLKDDSGDDFDTAEAYTITTGTGAGTTTAASVPAEGNAPLQSEKIYTHFDIVMKTQEAGIAIGSYNAISFNRNFGDTYYHLEVDLSGAKGDRTPFPFQTLEDEAFTNSGLTEANVIDLVAATHGGDATTAQILFEFGTYTADVNNNGATESYSARLDVDDPDNDTLLKAYLAAQWIVSKDRSESLNGRPASLYRSADEGTFVDKPFAPIGAYSGGKMIFAQGVYPINVPSTEASNYEAKDNSGVSVLPPTFVSGSITGLIGTSPYDRVTVFQSTGTDSELVKKDEMASHASNNAAGDGTFEVTAAIPADKPATGSLHVVDVSAGNEHKYRYASFSGAIFTLPTEITDATDGAGTSTALINSGATFTTDDLEVGDLIRNVTDGSWAYVESIDSDTGLTTSPLQGGSDNTWASGDTYSIHTLVVTATSSDTAYVGYIDGLALGSTLGGAFQYVTPRPLVIRVRNNRHGTAPMVPFVVTSSLGSSGFSIPVSRFVDTQSL